MIFLLCLVMDKNVIHHAHNSCKATQGFRHPLMECSGANKIIWWKQSRPKGVIIMVSRDEGAMGSSKLMSMNTFPPTSCASVWSTAGSKCCFLFAPIHSREILTLPFCLGTTTMPVHHSVGCSTVVMTPLFSSSPFCWNSSSQAQEQLQGHKWFSEIVPECLIP